MATQVGDDLQAGWIDEASFQTADPLHFLYCIFRVRKNFLQILCGLGLVSGVWGRVHGVGDFLYLAS